MSGSKNSLSLGPSPSRSRSGGIVGVLTEESVAGEML